MALKAPEAPTLHFRERDGFITVTTSPPQDEPEEVVEEEAYEEETVEESGEEVEDDFFSDDEESSEEAEEEAIEEAVEETPADEERTVIERPVEKPAETRREPTVKVKPADAGGRSGSALPTPSEMAAYAEQGYVQQPSDRGKAILREFEEEDRRLAEQRTTSKKAEPHYEKSSPSFEFGIEPPSGGMKWVVLIAILTVLGFIFVRQLAHDPLKPRRRPQRKSPAGVKVSLETDMPPPPKPPLKKPPAPKKDDTKHIEIRI